jgi:hypothetical protein
MLGASLGYMVYKREAMEGRLVSAVKEWEGAGATRSDLDHLDGVNFSEIKKAWKHTNAKHNDEFNERLPQQDRDELLSAEAAHAKEVEAYDRSMGPAPSIEGVYLEMPF